MLSEPGSVLPHNRLIRLVFIAFISSASLCTAKTSPAKPPPARIDGTFTATAYSVTGTTASGESTHRHVVAADPSILPIGSRIKIRRAGRYSGEYVVADTGEKIEGRKLDIYLPSTTECKRFGKKPVRVKVIEIGNGTREAAKQADQAVKKDVAQEVSKGAVGNAATEHDWAAKKKTSSPPSSDHPADETANPKPTAPQ